MNELVRADAYATLRFWPLAAGLALIVCSARLGWVMHGMPEAPMLDEWSAIDGIALSNAANAFDPRYLLAPHNEHLLVWTKLLDWIQLRVSDNQFDARPVGMLLALLSGAAAALLLAAAACRLARGRVAFLVAGVALVGLPYAWENLTENWNNSHALLVAGAFATLYLALYGRGVAAAVLMPLAALFSALAMGSGAVAPALGIAIVVVRWRGGDLRASSAVALLAAQAGAVALAVTLLAGRMQGGSRPTPDVVLAILQFIALMLAFAPAACLGWRILRTPRAARGTQLRDDAFAVVLASWGALHIAAMIAFRAEFRIWFPISRYMDTIAFALLASLYCALRLAADDGAPRLRGALLSGARIFAAIALLAAPLPLALFAWQAARFERAQALIGDVIRNDDAAAIDRADADALAYPDRGYLRAHLAEPRVQRILGDRIGTRAQAAPAVALSRQVEQGLIRYATMLCPFVALAAAWLIAAAFRGRAPPPAVSARGNP